MGGMAAQIPIKNNPKANDEALAKVLADKEREAGDGHDGTWVAHPGLVPIALQAFDNKMPTPNQISRIRDDVHVTASDLLVNPQGTITEDGVRSNIRVAVQYLEAWLGGLGCVPLYNLMEDAATAEIARSQVWQWLHYGSELSSGERVDSALFERVFPEELARIESEVGSDRYHNGHFSRASELFRQLVTRSDFVEFLTLPAYEFI